MKGIQWGRVDTNVKVDDVVIICSGMSLRNVDLTRLKQKNCYIITVNGAGAQIDYAHAWFTLDPWGLNGPQLPPNHCGKLYAAVPDDYGTPYARAHAHRVTPNYKVTLLHRLMSHNMVDVSSDTAYKMGLSEDPSCINTGNSGYGAINLAYHLRPKRIILLGMDAGIGYFYTDNARNRPLNTLPLLCKSALPQLQNSNIEIINGSQISKILCYPRMAPNDAINLLNDK